VFDIEVGDHEYAIISDPFLVMMPSGQKIIVIAHEKYEYSIFDDELIDYYEEVLDNNPTTQKAAGVFKARIKNPRTTQVAWGYDDIDMPLPKGNVVRKRPCMNPGFCRDSIYG